jgi:hypothetical protein
MEARTAIATAATIASGAVASALVGIRHAPAHAASAAHALLADRSLAREDGANAALMSRPLRMRRHAIASGTSSLTWKQRLAASDGIVMVPHTKTLIQATRPLGRAHCKPGVAAPPQHRRHLVVKPASSARSRSTHICGIAVRNPQIVAVARHYGLSIATCVPADPQSKGGSEATVKIAKADIVPTDHNLRPPIYEDFTELELAWESLCERVNACEHRVTRRPPAVMLAKERDPLHPLPAVPDTLCLGRRGRVSWSSTISLRGAHYSVPSTLVDERVCGRVDGTELVVVHANAPGGPREVARRELTTPGRPAIRRVPRAYGISSARHAKRPQRSSSSTSATPSGASEGQAWGRATTSASRR